MNRTSLLAASGLLATALLGPAALAVADDSPTPAATPAAAATGTATGSSAASSTAGPAGTSTSTSTSTAASTAASTATSTATVTPSSTPTPTVTPTPVVHRVSVSTRKTLVALRHYRITGSVRPAAPRPVTVTVQRLSGGSWKKVHADAVDAKGRYAVRWSTNRPGRQVFRAVARWHDGKRAVSSRLKRTVLARADAIVSGPLSRRSVPYSYRSGCPVGPKSLRKITINRFTYSHTIARGTLVVRAGAVHDLLEVFRAAFASRFPIRSMKPTDAYYKHGHRTPTGSDIAAMRSDNTSAFNCRPVTGNPYRMSQHSYGNAIDINTVRNPYVVGHRVYPGFAKTYLNRHHVRTGMITKGSVIARRMRGNGWPWGARWAHPDYQHFSSNGG